MEFGFLRRKLASDGAFLRVPPSGGEIGGERWNVIRHADTDGAALLGRS